MVEELSVERIQTKLESMLKRLARILTSDRENYWFDYETIKPIVTALDSIREELTSSIAGRDIVIPERTIYVDSDNTVPRRQLENLRFDILDTLQDLRNLKLTSESQPTVQTLSVKTRKDIFDCFQANNTTWSGRLDDCQFLSRLYDLSLIPPLDGQFQSSYDEIKARSGYCGEWESPWIIKDDRFNLLQCHDSVFLSFLSETIHPLVRDTAESEKLLYEFNQHLRPAGWHLIKRSTIAGAPVYEGQRLLKEFVPSIPPSENSQLLGMITTKLENIRHLIETDADAAIVISTELLKTVCRHILDRKKIELPEQLELPQVVEILFQELNINPMRFQTEDELDKIVHNIAWSLWNIVTGINAYSYYSIRKDRESLLTARHARLVSAAAANLAIFLFETFEEKEKD